MTTLRRAPFVFCALALCGLHAQSTAEAAGKPVQRRADAVVLSGAQLPSLRGAQPKRILGFRRAGRAWKQIPVQVDERALVDFRAVRQSPNAKPFSHLAYTDANTFAGADPDRTFDADDELVAMARDAGDRADPGTHPRNVRVSSRRVITIADPLAPARRSYLYLYTATRPADQSAGKSYVDYKFQLASGDAKTTYDYDGIADNGNGAPANPESSTVRTPFYRQHLLSRWIEDELRIDAGSATGVDVLDGDKAQVNFGCGRSELTFSRGGGGFIANKSGPVRAIRSYIGANSGTYTQRDHFYYDRADITRTYLRVHPGIATISQFYDFSPAAFGMTYRNSRNPEGVLIDGAPEAIEPGASSWEQVSGPQGSVSIVSRVATDLPGLTVDTFRLDDATDPPVAQCGGYADRAAIGAAGLLIKGSGDNTDPTLGPAYKLTATRATFYGTPNERKAVASLRSRQVDAPLRLSVR